MVLRKMTSSRKVCIPAVSYDASLQKFLQDKKESSVHSVFSRAFNIRKGDIVVGITSQKDFFPVNIVIPEKYFLSNGLGHSKPGVNESVVIEKGIMDFIDSGLLIDTRGAVRRVSPCRKITDVAGTKLRENLCRLYAGGGRKETAAPAALCGMYISGTDRCGEIIEDTGLIFGKNIIITARVKK